MSETLAQKPQIEITPAMIEAAAEILWKDPLLDITEGWAEDLAEKMLRCALRASRGETYAARLERE
jgi:hypothetical protein